MKIYCLHHTPAKERKEILLKSFERKGFNDVEWIENFLPQDIKKENLQINHPLNDAALSLYLKHQYALEKAYYSGIEDFVIFEDDVILPDFATEDYFYESYYEFLDMHGDILNIGTAFGMAPKKTYKQVLVYHEPHFTTRCAHAYRISKKCLDKILPEFHNIDDAWDWKLNNLIKKYNLKSCYVEPGLQQASLDGDYRSLLR